MSSFWQSMRIWALDSDFDSSIFGVRTKRPPRLAAERLKMKVSDSGEGADGRGLVVLDVEDGVELGDLEQVVDLLGEVQELELAA